MLEGEPTEGIVAILLTLLDARRTSSDPALRVVTQPTGSADSAVARRPSVACVCGSASGVDGGRRRRRIGDRHCISGRACDGGGADAAARCPFSDTIDASAETGKCDPLSCFPRCTATRALLPLHPPYTPRKIYAENNYNRQISAASPTRGRPGCGQQHVRGLAPPAEPVKPDPR